MLASDVDLIVFFLKAVVSLWPFCIEWGHVDSEDARKAVGSIPQFLGVVSLAPDASYATFVATVMQEREVFGEGGCPPVDADSEGRLLTSAFVPRGAQRWVS